MNLLCCFVKSSARLFCCTMSVSNFLNFFWLCMRLTSYSITLTIQRKMNLRESFITVRRMIPTDKKMKSSCLRLRSVVNTSKNYLGSTANESIFRKEIQTHSKLTWKSSKESYMPDDTNRTVAFQSWEICFDKGYVGAQRRIRAVVSTKKLLWQLFSTVKKEKNEEIAIDNIIMENQFGRLVASWGVFFRQKS